MDRSGLASPAQSEKDSMIHSSVRSVNLTLNIESSSSDGGEVGKKKKKSKKRGGDGKSKGGILDFITSCCFANPQDSVDSFGHDSNRWSSRSPDEVRAQRLFSRNPSTPRREQLTNFSDVNRTYSTNHTHFMLPPQSGDEIGKKTLVLDLDETLVHSSFEYLEDADLVLPVEVQGIMQEVYVRKRPGLDKFLEFVGEHYEVGVFTASVIKYADAVLDRIDPGKVVKWRLFRESCCQTNEGYYVKDLGCLGRPLEDTIIIDNSPHSYLFHPENAIGIKSFIDDRDDNHLVDLLPFLHEATTAKDVREALRSL